ncbi:hypothetical protein D3C75_699810 [compost metagenome]
MFGLVQGFFQHLHPARQHGGPQAAQPVVDVEAMALGQFAHFIGGPAHAGPQALGAFDAQGLFQRRHVARPAEQCLATVAAGRGPGHAAGFQQRYTLAGLGQAQGGVQAAEAGANDQDFGVVAALQGRVQGNAGGVGLGVVAGDMLGGLFEHAGVS